MASFFSDLWELIFTPGTLPALIIATHVSFATLLVTLATMAYTTRLIHFVNLLVIAVVLYGLVIWFMNELKTAKLKDNDQLKREAEGATMPSTSDTVAATGVAPKTNTTKLRKT